MPKDDRIRLNETPARKLTAAEREQRQQASRKHGIHAFESRGERALAPAEVARLQELRNLVRTAPGRREIREEIVARLVVIARKVFNDMEQMAGSEEWWESGVVKRGGTYLAELRRWLDTFPTQDGSQYDAELERIREVVEEHSKQE